MSLFNFRNKKQKTEQEIVNFEKATEHINNIKVLGSGCKSCHELYENAKKAADTLHLSVKVEYITDLEQIMGYGAMSMPAFVVNEKVVSTGKVLKEAEIKQILCNIEG